MIRPTIEPCPVSDLPFVDALEACAEAQSWLNEKKNAPTRARLFHAAVAVQKAIHHIREARAEVQKGRKA